MGRRWYGIPHYFHPALWSRARSFDGRAQARTRQRERAFAENARARALDIQEALRAKMRPKSESDMHRSFSARGNDAILEACQSSIDADSSFRSAKVFRRLAFPQCSSNSHHSFMLLAENLELEGCSLRNISASLFDHAVWLLNAAFPPVLLFIQQ